MNSFILYIQGKCSFFFSFRMKRYKNKAFCIYVAIHLGLDVKVLILQQPKEKHINVPKDRILQELLARW